MFPVFRNPDTNLFAVALSPLGVRNDVVDCRPTLNDALALAETLNAGNPDGPTVAVIVASHQIRNAA